MLKISRKSSTTFTIIGFLIVIYTIAALQMLWSEKSNSDFYSMKKPSIISQNKAVVSNVVQKNQNQICKGPRVGIIAFLPFKSNNFFLIQLVTMLYASWRYITSNAILFANVPHCSRIDLLLYCEDPTCNLLPSDCMDIRFYANTVFQSFCAIKAKELEFFNGTHKPTVKNNFDIKT